MGEEFASLLKDPDSTRRVTKHEDLQGRNLFALENELLRSGADVLAVKCPGEAMERYFLEKKIDDQRTVFITVKGFEFIPGSQDLDQYFKVDRCIVRGPQGKYVDLAGRLMPGTELIMGFKGLQPDDAISRSDPNFWFSPVRRQLCFGQINSLVGIAALWHEGGHAVDFATSSETQKSLIGDARWVFNGVNAALLNDKPEEIEAIEKKFGLDYMTARYLVAAQENFASYWAMADLDLVKDDLGITPEMAGLYEQAIEKWWQTYDALVLPEVGVSALARSLEWEETASAREHLQNYFVLKELLHGHGLSEGDNLLAVASEDPGRFRFCYRGSHIELGYISQDTVILMDLFLEYALQTQSPLSAGAAGEPRTRRLDLITPQRYLDTQPDHATVLATEKTFIECLEMALVRREDAARAQIEFLKTSLGALFPDRVVDPLEIARRIVSSPRGTSQSAFLRESQMIDEALKPLHRLALLEDNLAGELVDKFSLHKYRRHLFNPKDGKPLTSSHDRLIYLCESAVQEIEELPERNTFPDDLEYENFIIARLCALKTAG